MALVIFEHDTAINMTRHLDKCIFRIEDDDSLIFVFFSKGLLDFLSTRLFIWETLGKRLKTYFLKQVKKKEILYDQKVSGIFNSFSFIGTNLRRISVSFQCHPNQPTMDNLKSFFRNIDFNIYLLLQIFLLPEFTIQLFIK